MEAGMSIFREFAQDLVRSSRKTLLKGILLNAASGLAGGVGIVLIVPLLSVAGLAPGSEGFLKTAGSLAGHLSPGLRLVVVLVAYTVIIMLQALLDRASFIVDYSLSGEYSSSLRTRYFESAAKAEWEYILTCRKSDFSNSLTTEIERIGLGALNMLRTIAQVIVALAQLAIAFAISMQVTMAVMVAGIAFFLFTNSAGMRAKKLGQTLVGLNRRLHGDIADQFGSFKEAKIYGIESGAVSEFSALCAQVKDNVISLARVQSLPNIVHKAGAALLVSIFLFFSIRITGLSVSGLIMEIFIFARLWPFFSGFQTGVQQISAILPSFAAYRAHMAGFDSHAESGLAGRRDRIPLAQSLECRDLCFEYQGNRNFALRDVSLRVEARSMTAIVGRSGSGKSTLADLLCGLLRARSGMILADGQPIDGDQRSAWRKNIGYVPQDPFLFNGTIRENLLRFNLGADEPSMRESLSLASAEFVMGLPQGLDTVIGDRGIKLSGGERQRIVLARALLRDPSFLVLDEATSALDNEHEYRIQKALTELTGRLTILVIAHRLSTIRRASQIIVLDRGAIAERGGYDELAALPDGVFRTMLSYGELT
jgi:ATP-binding cassette subfamily C protein